MNDKFTDLNPEDAEFAKKLSALSEQTNPDPRFEDELEHKLKAAHKPKTLWLISSSHSILPSLGWVALVAAAGLLLIWSIQNLIPAPQPAAENTPVIQGTLETPTPAPDGRGENITPKPDREGYDWRQTKLYLSVPLPQSPADAKLYLLKDEQPASVETAKALAAQFGIQGGVYETPSTLPGAIGYLITDGKQRLYVQSDINFSYYTDYPSYSFMSGGRDITDEQAASAIDAFMQTHGLSFPYRIENPHLNPGLYHVLPLTPDGARVQFNYNIPSRIVFTLDQNRQVVQVASYRADYEALDGEYGIITAEEAFQKVLDSSDVIQNGVLESVSSSGGADDSRSWSRAYPDNVTVTIYGQPQSYPASEAGGAPFIAIGQFTAVGNVSGIENIDPTVYIEATGQFVIENGIRKFNVESWKVTSAIDTYLSGSLRREGSQTILTADGSGEYFIQDAPADVPLNTTPGDEFLSIHGFTADGKFSWDLIQFFPSGGMGGGGGGGGGLGFYKINLSGTPVPFPSPTPTPKIDSGYGNYTVKEGDTLSGIASRFSVTLEELMEANDITEPGLIYISQRLIIPGAQPDQPVASQRMEGQRGILNITIYEQANGGQRFIYGFLTNNPDFPYLLLEGDGLEALQKYNSRPVDVWGTVGGLSEGGMMVLNVERFEIPFPDLQFQILKGTAKIVEANNQPVVLFTDENGNDFVELVSNCLDPFGPDAVVGQPGDPILIEALLVPDLTYGGYPAVCVFSSAMAVNPKNNQPVELPITADQPSILPEPPSAGAGNIPTLAIESVELVYYAALPPYGYSDPSNEPRYIQPAWRFSGHYSNGDVFEILVQALKQEYLLPELVPNQPPG